MASAAGHFLCLLVFIAWSVSSFDLAFGARSLSEEHHDPEEQSLFPFKKFPKFKPFLKSFHHKPKPISFKHKFPKFPPHEEESLQVSAAGGVAQVDDEKYLPKFKFPKFLFPKKKSPKFPFPPKVTKPFGEFPPKFKFPPLTEELPKPVVAKSSTSGSSVTTAVGGSSGSAISSAATTKTVAP
ncbi:hypothetical protein Dimus_002981 [Dionaea muscipula]